MMDNGGRDDGVKVLSDRSNMRSPVNWPKESGSDVSSLLDRYNSWSCVHAGIC